MSLYWEAASVILEGQKHSDSIRDRVFSHSRDFRSPGPQLYALLVETQRWNSVISEIIENSEILKHERKLTPALALVLVHDLLIAKNGIAAPASHPLRATVEKHRVRLQAELTKLRVRKGQPNIEALRSSLSIPTDPRISDATQRQVRWVRINILKSTLEDQLSTTFAHFKVVQSLDPILKAGAHSPPKAILYIDRNIPNLVGLPVTTDIVAWPAYHRGVLILQDKASCFPACLLDPHGEDYVIDACAAPGNKTTHLSALMHNGSTTGEPRIVACERDKQRARVLEQMVKLAGAETHVNIRAGQDFLQLSTRGADNDDVWTRATCLLLDPSCSGSGIIGRGDAIDWILPRTDYVHPSQGSRKRKREGNVGKEKVEKNHWPVQGDDQILQARLQSLSAFQLRLVLHAFTFPRARRITYSTCSVYDEENERVVLAALTSAEARAGGWRILYRDEQVEGMRAWKHRGKCTTMANGLDVERVAEACIRTSKHGEDGTQGFFVAAFVRDVAALAPTEIEDSEEVWGHEEWHGFSDDSLA